MARNEERGKEGRSGECLGGLSPLNLMGGRVPPFKFKGGEEEVESNPFHLRERGGGRGPIANGDSGCHGPTQATWSPLTRFRLFWTHLGVRNRHPGRLILPLADAGRPRPTHALPPGPIAGASPTPMRPTNSPQITGHPAIYWKMTANPQPRPPHTFVVDFSLSKFYIV